MLLACGDSPIMADDLDNAVEITAICGGLNINIGTLNQHTIPTMFASGKRANELGHPVVLDPVEAEASTLRTDTALRLLKEVKFMVVRGNISEIKTLTFGSGTTKGVDANVADKVTEEVCRRVGGNIVLGVSVHTVEEARQAIQDGANYLGLGSGIPYQHQGRCKSDAHSNPSGHLPSSRQRILKEPPGSCGVVRENGGPITRPSTA